MDNWTDLENAIAKNETLIRKRMPDVILTDVERNAMELCQRRGMCAVQSANAQATIDAYKARRMIYLARLVDVVSRIKLDASPPPDLISFRPIGAQAMFKLVEHRPSIKKNRLLAHLFTTS